MQALNPPTVKLSLRRMFIVKAISVNYDATMKKYCFWLKAFFFIFLGFRHFAGGRKKAFHLVCVQLCENI